MTLSQNNISPAAQQVNINLMRDKPQSGTIRDRDLATQRPTFFSEIDILKRT